MVWWAQVERSGQSALAHVLFARKGAAIDPEAFGAEEVPVPADRDARGPLRSPGGSSRGTVAVRVIDEAPHRAESWSRTGRRATPARSSGWRPSSGVPDRRRQRWSFSAIVDQASVGRFDPHDASMADRGAGDEQEPGDTGLRGRCRSHRARRAERATARPTPALPSSPLADLPAGTAFGTLVHSVLEEVDFGSDRLRRGAGGGGGPPTPVAIGGPDPGHPARAPPPTKGGRSLVAGFRRGHRDPTRDRRAAASGWPTSAPADRLTEVSFDLRLADDGPTPSMRGIGALVAGPPRSPAIR